MWHQTRWSLSGTSFFEWDTQENGGQCLTIRGYVNWADGCADGEIWGRLETGHEGKDQKAGASPRGAVPALFAVIVLCAALRGEEVPLMNLEATREFTMSGLEHTKEEKMGVVIVLHVWFKNELGERGHLMPMVRETNSGLKPATSGMGQEWERVKASLNLTLTLNFLSSEAYRAFIRPQMIVYGKKVPGSSRCLA
jgi:hypothetical protein